MFDVAIPLQRGHKSGKPNPWFLFGDPTVSTCEAAGCGCVSRGPHDPIQHYIVRGKSINICTFPPVRTKPHVLSNFPPLGFQNNVFISSVFVRYSNRTLNRLWLFLQSVPSLLALLVSSFIVCLPHRLHLLAKWCAHVYWVLMPVLLSTTAFGCLVQLLLNFNFLRWRTKLPHSCFSSLWNVLHTVTLPTVLIS